MKRECKGGDIYGRWPYIHVLIVIVSALLIYSGIISAPFFFDDRFTIVDNYRLHDLANFWPPYGNRYISYLSFGLNYRLGALDVRGYHLVNILIHIVNAVLVYKLVTVTFKTPLLVKTGEAGERRKLLVPAIATLSSLIFLTHPLQTSAVTYVTQRFVSLATLFYLMTILLFVGWRLRTAEDRIASLWRGRAVYLLALLFAILAQKTKEITFTLPVILILYEFVFFSASKSLAFIRRLVMLVPFAFTLAIVPLSLLAHKAGYGVGKIVDDGTSAVQIDDLLSLSRHDYLLTQFRVVVTYLRLLFFPAGQNFDYDYPVFHSLGDWRVLLSLFFLLSIIAFAVFCFMRFRGGKKALLLLASCGIFWFFITLSIESSIIPIKDVIFEHRVYLPSIGMAIAFSSLLFHALPWCSERLGSKPYGVKTVTVLIIVITLPLGFSAFVRNKTWQTPVKMYEDITGKSPDKARSHNNLGIAYVDMKLYDKAAIEFETTLRLDPALVKTHVNLGKVLLLMGRHRDAIESYKAALDAEPDNVELRYSIAEVYSENGMTGRAIEYYRGVLIIKPDHINARNNLGSALYVEGRVDEAIDAYRLVLRLQPAHAEALYNLAMAYQGAGLYEEAIRYYSEFLALNPVEYRSVIGSVRSTIVELERLVREGAGG